MRSISCWSEATCLLVLEGVCCGALAIADTLSDADVAAMAEVAAIADVNANAADQILGLLPLLLPLLVPLLINSPFSLNSSQVQSLEELTD